VVTNTPLSNHTVELTIDDIDLDTFLKIASNFGEDALGYVVTPNLDHMLRYYEEPDFRAAYESAEYRLLDSRLFAIVLGLTGYPRPAVCVGSELTEKLFENVIKPRDTIIIIGGSKEQVAQLCGTYDLRNVAHYNPPMGFIQDPVLV
jgi:UDP-N-acetyl-D-mannosaminuronic acid transferase (WecB/TagA/CpsF family)